MMKKLLFILFSVCSLTAVAQNVKSVAVLEVVDKENKIPGGVKDLLRQSIVFGIKQVAGYDAYTRVEVDQIMREHDFQRTGAVDENQRKRIGYMTGAQYILVAQASVYSGKNITIFANVIDIETGRMSESSIPKIANIDDPEKMYEACADVAKSLLGISTRRGGGSSSSSSSSYNNYGSSYSRNQDFTESAYGINMQMIWVEGGSFLMGCTSEQGSDCESDEKNVRRVTLDGFYIGMLEVTQSQWEAVMGTSVYQQRNKGNPDWSMAGVGSDYPMYYVNWNEAMDFCRELSRLTGKTYTLPTEAQWEYAARGGTKADGTKYAGSNSIDAVAWYTDNSGSSTHRCGTKRANALGIYDMSGNVYEWCKDWYGDYKSYDTNNPVGPSSGSSRVGRGGGWSFIAGLCYVAFRGGNSPSYRSDNLGFRVVCIP